AVRLTAAPAALIAGNDMASLGTAPIDLRPGSDGARIYANHIRDVGTVRKGAGAIIATGVGRLRVAYNDIADTA
ncbi:hypothetical protein ACSTKX_24810, partial [Vibrio parahaemolyticus]